MLNLPTTRVTSQRRAGQQDPAFKTTAMKISTRISNHFNVDSLGNSCEALTRSNDPWIACPSHR